jgi:head-tail adaptor
MNGKASSGMIGMQTRVGLRQVRVQLQNPGPNVPDGDGGYTQTWNDCAPPFLFAHIETPVSHSADEEQAANAVTTIVRRIVNLPFHPQVSTHTRILFTDRRGILRTLTVDAVNDIEERNVELELTCKEVVR